MDLFSRRIISWELAPTLETKYVVNSINKSILTTGKRPKVIHTDRGTQYTSVEYYEETEGIIKTTVRNIDRGSLPADVEVVEMLKL